MTGRSLSWVMKTVSTILITVSSIFLCSSFVFGQSKCLSAQETKTILAQMDSPQNVSFSKDLRDELLKLQDRNQRLYRTAIEEMSESRALRKRVAKTKEAGAARLCQILKEFGWPSTSRVGKDGVAAAFYLLKHNAPFELQVDLLPGIVAAVRRKEIEKGGLAELVDRMRLDAGLKQLFGTQASVVDGVLLISPIDAESQVDERRKQFELPPLAEYLRHMERVHRMPLVRSTVIATSSSRQDPITRTIATILLNRPSAVEDEIVRVETNVVSLNVSVFSNKLRTYVGTLQKEDFTVLEDGTEEAISYFANADVPFDLVLLIDLSGSTLKKRELIRQTTQRFIEVARPSDKLAIVAFSETTNVLSALTADRAKLFESAKRIHGEGGTKVWDALKFTLDQVVGPKTAERRRAIVLMSDGLDDAFLYQEPRGSQISFADLLEAVRHNDTLIIPIYLDTEHDRPSSALVKRIYENARKTLSLLARESGGLYYKARKMEDLNGVYEQVINDLGRVYSLGYKPTNERRNGSWRAVKVEVPSRTDLVTRAKPGYYAN